MNTKPNVLIFNAYDALDVENVDKTILQHYSALQELQRQGVPVVELLGRNNGTSQMSILVVGFQHTDLVETLAKQSGQDSYLRSHGDRYTERVSLKKAHVESVGYLKPISEDGAWLKGTYAYNPQTNTFYALESRP